VRSRLSQLSLQVSSMPYTYWTRDVTTRIVHFCHYEWQIQNSSLKANMAERKTVALTTAEL
jgi:hypothetical protein